MSYDVIYVIGSPRSGTTILGDILDRHPQIVHWMEPYFVYDFHCGFGEDDIRTETQATPEAIRFIRSEADRMMRKSGKDVLVIKLLANSFRLPFIMKVHPNARFIHLIRDGRDVAISLRNRKLYREETMKRKSIRRLVREARGILKYHNLRQLALLALFEIKTRRSWNLQSLFNKSKWDGHPYFGPRPPGWRELFRGRSDLEVAAIQWVELERHAQEGLSKIDSERICDLRYEALSANPEGELTRILDFIGVDTTPAQGISSDMRPDNFNKWRRELDSGEKKAIGDIMDPMLSKLGYDPTCETSTT